MFGMLDMTTQAKAHANLVGVMAAGDKCAGKGVRADACAWTSNGACHLVIPRNGPVRNRAAYRRHEVAHCNGWEHQHHTIASQRDPLDW